ncbi:MAG: thiamine phosphate synthase [Rhodobacteraceae bacterium]|jgi:thiamine-phosphate pyrophosphorylase|nr:thiamine phosphate synthase [Paracoccaceae bacterium]
MAADDRPQITLITPPAPDLDTFAGTLARVMDTVEIACLRLSLATKDTDLLGRAADACREIGHARDVAVVIDSHILLAERHGLDGVHLPDGARSLRKARKDLGEDAIVGAHCGATRHEGLAAGEAGADYVAFGPVGATGLGDGSRAGWDLFEWWSEMIEVPVIAEGGLTADLVAKFGPVTDFFGIGEEIWADDDPAAALKRLMAPLG